MSWTDVERDNGKTVTRYEVSDGRIPKFEARFYAESAPIPFGHLIPSPHAFCLNPAICGCDCARCISAKLTEDNKERAEESAERRKSWTTDRRGNVPR